MVKVVYSYRLRKIAGLARGKILDIGFMLLPNPFLKGEIIGVDIALPKSKPSNYSNMVKADVTKKLPFKDNSVDTVILGGVIEHIENHVLALKEINRVLKPNGVLLMETPNPYFLPVFISDMFMNLRYYFEDTHISLFPRRIVLKLLWHSGFDLAHIESCGVNLNNYVTLPVPQQLAQDIIYVGIKRIPKNKRFYRIRNLRRDNYEFEDKKLK